MQAILTKYLGATDTKDSRIKAWCDAGSITIPYPHELSCPDTHAAAAMALVRKLGWTEPSYKFDWVVAYTGNANAPYVFVFADPRESYKSDFNS